MTITAVRALDEGMLHKEVALTSPELDHILQQMIGKAADEMAERLQRAMGLVQRLLVMGKALAASVFPKLEAEVAEAAAVGRQAR